MLQLPHLLIVQKLPNENVPIYTCRKQLF